VSPERPSVYERLSLEAAARVDAVCDRFENAWKAARTGAAAPRLSHFLQSCEEPERTALAGELLALDRACRERYGFPIGSDSFGDLNGGVQVPTTCATRSNLQAIDRPNRQPPDWPRIPGLELMQSLGSGGMGVVFKARQVALDREVAVKFLRDAHRDDSARRERFLQEARAVARLKHPHLVQLYEFGELPAANGTTSQPYLVLEYVSGGSLSDLVRGSPQPPVDAARLVETLADAIHYAHQQGVIHRDLKPANVLLQRSDHAAERPSLRAVLSADLCAKITDFGLAKVQESSDLTHTGELLGTPSYMAPEQAGKSTSITAAVDVYGLGAILYETLTGRAPFAAATIEATICLVRLEEPVPPRRLQPTVPRDLETICLKCLRKDPARRYATARDLADDLRNFCNGEPIRARPVGAGERVVGWCRRNPGVAVLVAALVLVFVTGTSGVLWQWQRASQNAVEAEQNALAFQRERDTARLEQERAERRLQMIRERVGRLETVARDLLKKPGLYRTGQAVLEEALAFYKELLPEEGNDPRVRREAAKLFGQVAWIHSTLGQADKAAEAWERQAGLLSTLIESDPNSKELRFNLADILRWRANALRAYGRVDEARSSYARATELHEALLRESPDDPKRKIGLANTLLNSGGLLSRRDQRDEIDAMYRRVLDLQRSAVRAEPKNSQFKAELAIALGDLGDFMLETGQAARAEAALLEALEVDDQVLASGQLKGSSDHYVARNWISLGRVRMANGRIQDAEKAYRKAVSILERTVREMPESAYRRMELGNALSGVADFLTNPGQGKEAEAIRRRVVNLFEKLHAGFPEELQYRQYLVRAQLALVGLLWQLDRQSDADEVYRQALALGPEDPAMNNERAWYLATNSDTRIRKPELAVQYARKSVAARPEVQEYRNTLGVAYYRNGDDKSAIAELEKSMSLQAGGDCYDWIFLAMANWRLGERDKARSWFDRAMKGMEKQQPYNQELRRFRAEAEALMKEELKGK
jgi:tetratricopeptide (TPR) repeat protein/tRNA A-37 threonylcarbamoyl transferase component Bud32